MLNRKRVTRFFISIGLVLLVLGAVWYNKYSLYDWFRLRNYQPTAAISSMAQQTAMNSYGKRLFYAQHPSLESKVTFRSKCSVYEQTIVLGCYKNQQGIFILDVTDERLSGVEEVTAAHEMLHAAYDRLSSSKKKQVNNLLDLTYSSLEDERIKKTIDQYKALNADVPNEMHSIFATELKNIPPELEEYYSTYFDNRYLVVELSEKYEQAFTTRKDQIDGYDKQLAGLKTQIEESEHNAEQKSEAIRNEKQQLDSLIRSGQTEAYNQGVDPYNQKIKDYNALVGDIRSMIDRYNSLVKTRNSIALEEQELMDAIDSRLTKPTEL